MGCAQTAAVKRVLPHLFAEIKQTLPTLPADSSLSLTLEQGGTPAMFFTGRIVQRVNLHVIFSLGMPWGCLCSLSGQLLDARALPGMIGLGVLMPQGGI